MEWGEWQQPAYDRVATELSRADPDIEVVRISECDLPALPDELWRLQRLRHLAVHADYLHEIPAAIGRLTRLESLQISAPITALPPQIGLLAKLRELTVTSGELAELPVTTGELRRLEVLQAQSAPLKAIPAELGRLVSLRRLALNGSSLETGGIPAALWELAELRELSIPDCRVDELPPGIGNLRALRDLDLGNGILCDDDGLWSAPPADLWNLTTLETLILPLSGLTDIPSSIGHMTRLRYLDLSTCDVRELPPETTRLAGLEHLDLSWSLVRAVDPAVRSLPRLRELHLSRRAIDDPGLPLRATTTPEHPPSPE
ncbi:leucine-rich repeat domain-containing protein [Embleya sp. NPDC059259]|uniref:leucine-rich repeat domain-containing protein n=1 Tax=unclassified Embleya TaxID=2699296 RepID=UPI0036895D01